MEKDTNKKIIGVGVMTGGTVIQNIYNKSETPDKGDNLTIQERQEEIESYIISNDLSTATKLIVEFVTDFSKNKNYKREALLHQSNFKSLQDELRKYGKSSDLDRELKQLKNSLFEFIEIITQESKG